jgi:hypothetical protein
LRASHPAAGKIGFDYGDFMTLKVIGAGFGRTGTNTLKVALEMLGLGPCYHMYEVIQRPEHIAIWQKAAEGDLPDWEALFEGFNSGVDWPVSRFWRELAEVYPEAKIILSERDPEAWYASINKTIFETWRAEKVPADFAALRAMTRALIHDGVFGGHIENKDHVIEVFKKNGADVRAAFGPDRLLTFDPNQGWQPLCAFLGVPVPDEPFPHTNTTKDFLARRKGD